MDGGKIKWKQLYRRKNSDANNIIKRRKIELISAYSYSGGVASFFYRVLVLLFWKGGADGGIKRYKIFVLRV